MTVSSTARPECVFTHALGGLNKSGKPGGPSKKTHLNDSMCKLAAKTADDADLGVVLYTARGHGHSTGWEVRPGTPIRDISCCCHPLTGAPRVGVPDHAKSQKLAAPRKSPAGKPPRVSRGAAAAMRSAGCSLDSSRTPRRRAGADEQGKREGAASGTSCAGRLLSLRHVLKRDDMS